MYLFIYFFVYSLGKKENKRADQRGRSKQQKETRLDGHLDIAKSGRIRWQKAQGTKTETEKNKPNWFVGQSQNEF